MDEDIAIDGQHLVCINQYRSGMDSYILKVYESKCVHDISNTIQKKVFRAKLEEDLFFLEMGKRFVLSKTMIFNWRKQLRPKKK